MTDRSKSLTTSEIHERTQTCLAQNDVAAMKRLVGEILSDSYHEDTQDELVDALLSKDHAEMARECFTASAINDWCEANDEYLVLNCPNVFALWAEQTPAVVVSVGNALESLPSEERLAILLGQSPLVAGAFLHDALANDAQHWKNLTPTWLGPPDSATRQAAVGLGWRPSMLTAMVDSFLRASSTSSWLDALKYPYSLSLATLELQRIEGQKRRVQRGVHGGLVGKALNTVRIRFECDKNANPLDVELALLLVEQTSLRNVLYLCPQTPRVAPEEQARLKSIVDLHVSLGCLEVLAEALCQDMVPGMQERNAVELALPETYESLESFTYGSK